MSSPQRKPPIILPATDPPSDSSNSAVFIFLHGLGDDAEGVEPIAQQFQSASKLPHLSWILPHAQFNHTLNMSAWFLPTKLSPITLRPELEDEEDESGLKESMAYLDCLLDEQVSAGVPPHRIVVGGFSQGHAVSLLTGLVSGKYSGKLGGVVGLSGYLPLAERVGVLRGEAGLEEKIGEESRMEVFLARGKRDMMVPKRYLGICERVVKETSVAEDKLVVKEYEGLGHTMRGDELRDMCEWLERVVPGVDG